MTTPSPLQESDELPPWPSPFERLPDGQARSGDAVGSVAAINFHMSQVRGHAAMARLRAAVEALTRYESIILIDYTDRTTVQSVARDALRLIGPLPPLPPLPKEHV